MRSSKTPLTLVPLEDRICFAAGSTLQTVGSGDGYTLKVNSYGRVAVVEIAAAEYAGWASGTQSLEVSQAMARRVYKSLPDDYDFLMMVNNDSVISSGASYAGLYNSAKNDTGGLGAELTNTTAAFGSAGRLQGLIHLTSLGAVSRGPSLHELMHRWGDSIPDWSREDPVHWGFSSVGGQLGGWQAGTLTDLGGGKYQAHGPLGNPAFGTFVNGGNSVPYSPLELYLMGLTGPETLEPLQIARGAAFGEQFGDAGQGRFTATSLETRTAADLVAQLGPRTPAVATSQKSFRGLVAIVTPAPVPQAVLDKMDTDVELFGLPRGDGDDSNYNFFEATGGRATLKLDGLPDGLGPRNVPPTAVLDAVAAADAVTVAVLANDSDANGDPLTVTAVTQPFHGTATLNADATVTYAPNPGTGGLDSADKFTYTVSDGRGGTATAEVTINIRSRRVPPPSAPPIPPGVTGYVVYGFAWRDRNSNGTLDAGDALPGTRIYNDSNANDKYDPGEPVAAPDATGFYALGIPLTDSIRYTATHPENISGSSYAFTLIDNAGRPGSRRNDYVFDNRWFAVAPPPVPPPLGTPPATSPVTPPVAPPVAPPGTPPVAPRAAFKLAPQFTVGLDRGGDGTVRLQNADQSPRFAVAPTAASGAAGSRTASADFNGDGIADLVVGTGPGGPTHVRVLDGKTQAELFALDPFEAGFTGGVYVAAGDVTGDGLADLVVTPDEGGGPRVRVFSGAGFGQVADFFGIDDPGFRGGARAAVADISGDGVGDLIVSAGFGGGPRVAGFDGKSMGGATPAKLFGDFLAFESTLRNGAFVTGGDLDGDGFAELVAGGGPGGGPRVTAFSGRDLLANAQTPVANFFAGDSSNRGGVRLAAKDLDGDGRADLLVGSGPGGGSRVTAYAGKSVAAGGTPPELFAFDAQPGFSGGVFVG